MLQVFNVTSFLPERSAFCSHFVPSLAGPSLRLTSSKVVRPPNPRDAGYGENCEHDLRREVERFDHFDFHLTAPDLIVRLSRCCLSFAGLKGYDGERQRQTALPFHSSNFGPTCG
jgi:hypothetical protein